MKNINKEASKNGTEMISRKDAVIWDTLQIERAEKRCDQSLYYRKNMDGRALS